MTKLLNENKAVTLTIGVCFIFLSYRILTTQSIYFSFLVWNLFLAGVPLAITTLVKLLDINNRLTLAFAFVIWLLFLPNAPYIITDIAHLRNSASQHIWIDIIVVFSFAICGLIMFYKSVLQMRVRLKKYLPHLLVKLITISTFYLIGFGIYIGRVLRYNSWDILQPKQLIVDCLTFVIKPITHIEVWQFTLLFGSLLLTGYYFIKLKLNQE